MVDLEEEAIQVDQVEVAQVDLQVRGLRAYVDVDVIHIHLVDLHPGRIDWV